MSAEGVHSLASCIGPSAGELRPPQDDRDPGTGIDRYVRRTSEMTSAMWRRQSLTDHRPNGQKCNIRD
jgi:hypothetical protein